MHGITETNDSTEYIEFKDGTSEADILRYAAADLGVVLEVGDDDDSKVEFQKSGGNFFDIRKGDTDQHELSGIVYCLGCPETADSQGDYVEDLAELKKGSASWLRRGGVIKLQHEHDTDCQVVESFVSDAPMTYRGTKIDKGCWVATISVGPEIFAKVSDGSLRGFSMSGTATSVEI